jgi:hypothetical protein
VTQARANNLPTFAQTVPNYNIQGTTLSGKKNITVPPPSSSKQPATAPAVPAQGKTKPLHHL